MQRTVFLFWWANAECGNFYSIPAILKPFQPFLLTHSFNFVTYFLYRSNSFYFIDIQLWPVFFRNWNAIFLKNMGLYDFFRHFGEWQEILLSKLLVKALMGQYDLLFDDLIHNLMLLNILSNSSHCYWDSWLYIMNDLASCL